MLDLIKSMSELPPQVSPKKQLTLLCASIEYPDVKLPVDAFSEPLLRQIAEELNSAESREAKINVLAKYNVGFHTNGIQSKDDFIYSIAVLKNSQKYYKYINILSRILEDISKNKLDKIPYYLLEVTDAVRGEIQNIDFDSLSQDIRHSGFEDLDNLLNIYPGCVWVVAARPGIGKTSFAVTVASRLLKHNYSIGFVSLEMPPSMIAAHITNLYARIYKGDVRTEARKDNAILEKVKSHWEQIKHNVAIVSPSILNTEDIFNSLLPLYKTCDYVFFDYIQLVRMANTQMTREQQVAEVSRTLKSLSLQFNTTTIALAQLNRRAETHPSAPQLGDIRDSGQIEQDADIVSVISREDDIAKLHVIKNRFGPLFDYTMIFDRHWVEFTEFSEVKLLERNAFDDEDLPF